MVACKIKNPLKELFGFTKGDPFKKESLIELRKLLESKLNLFENDSNIRLYH